MKRVFVLEDDPYNAILFRKLLEKRAACEVTLSEDPEALLEAARAGRVDLAILDVSLRNSRLAGRPVNGADVCRALKSDAATARVPVLLATAHAMYGDEQRLLAQSGADGYVSKPITHHEEFVSRALGLMEDAA
jgi:CheY-like chemotaxis protein